MKKEADLKEKEKQDNQKWSSNQNYLFKTSNKSYH